MHKKFEIVRTKIKGGRQAGRKVVANKSKSDLPLYAQNFPQKIYTMKIEAVRFFKNKIKEIFDP